MGKKTNSEEKEPKEPKIRRASDSKLPEIVNFVDDTTFTDIYQKLKRWQEIRVLEEQLREEKDALVTEFALTCESYNLKSGFRAGLVGFSYWGMDSTRKTLDKTLLLENGVTTAQIEASLKESEPFVGCRAVDFDIL